jgi:hypothetical protein
VVVDARRGARLHSRELPPPRQSVVVWCFLVDHRSPALGSYGRFSEPDGAMSVNPTQREAETRAALEEADVPVIAKPITRASRFG